MAERWLGFGRWQNLHVMSEPPPPPYLTRTFVCRCGKTFEPTPREREALEQLEALFGLDAAKAEALCEECAGAGHG